MLPDVGATEYLVIAIVALIVVGPKDLPVLLRKLGQFLAKLRGMASEFRASFDEMARQSELDELRKEVDAMRKGQLTDMAAQASGLQSSGAIDEITQSLNDVGVQLHPPMSYQYDIPAVVEEPAAPAKPARKSRAKASPGKMTIKAVAPPAPKTAGRKAAPTKAAAKSAATKTPAKAAPKAKAPPRKAAAHPRRPSVERG